MSSNPASQNITLAQADSLVDPFLQTIASNISSVTHTINHDFNWTLLYVYIPMLSVQLWIIIGLLGRMIKHLTGQELSLSTMVCELERIDILIAKSARRIERREHHLPTDVEKGVSKGLKNTTTTNGNPPPSSKEKITAATDPGERKGSGPKNPLLPLSPLHSEEKELPTTLKRSLPSTTSSSPSSTTTSTASTSSIPTPEDLISPGPLPYRHQHSYHPHHRHPGRPTIGAHLLSAVGNGNPLSLDPGQNPTKQINRHTPNWEVYPPTPETPSSSLKAAHFLMPPSLTSRGASSASVPRRGNVFANPASRT